MNDFMEYKGYYGCVEYYAEDGIYYGKVVNVPHWLIMYEGEDLADIKANFEEAIDDCLIMCEEDNEPPMPQSIETMQEFIAEKLAEKQQQNQQTAPTQLNQPMQLQPI
ncbi:MAG: hypothetical protein FWG64_03525 [Firmicutes bacterium]|nr:hypothetical protein [Bacillota bacterium]